MAMNRVQFQAGLSMDIGSETRASLASVPAPPAARRFPHPPGPASFAWLRIAADQEHT